MDEIKVDLKMDFMEIARLGKDDIYSMIKQKLEQKYGIFIELFEVEINPLEIVVDDSDDYVLWEAIAVDYKILTN